MTHLEDGTIQRHLDGELTAEEGWQVEAHLAECAACRARFEALGALVESVASLEAAVQPPMDLWPGIAAAIQLQGGRGPVLPAKHVRGRWRQLGLSFVAAAAVLLLGIALGRALPRPGSTTLADSTVPPDISVEFAAYDQEYDQAISDLLVVLTSMRDQLRPETVAAIEENLRIIDEAIEESRAALSADPANENLHRHLSTNLRTKLTVLRMVTGSVAGQT
jgi:hypothetical protein